jgi:pimeloyl-ACP methyl ester carboxylesterase
MKKLWKILKAILIKVVGIVFATLSALLLLAVILLQLTEKGGDVGFWRSSEIRENYESEYKKAMKALPNPAQRLDIPTSFGTVRVYIWPGDDPEHKYPLLLLPGRASGVPMWSENLPGLISQRTVLALDALGDSGLSEQTKKISNSQEQAEWLKQTLDALPFEKVHLVGHSFGGWSAANFASRYPDQVASLILLEPVFTFQGIHPSFYIKAIPSMIPFLPKRMKEAMLRELGGGAEINPDDPVGMMIAAATSGYVSKLPLPDQITTIQMESWLMPVYVAMAAKSPLHDAYAAEKTARDHVKDLTIKVWQEATHSLPMEAAEEIDQEILKFTTDVEKR